MIRRYEDKDLEAVMNIWLHANKDAHGFIDSDYWVNQFETVKEMIPQATVLVYELDETVVAFIGLMDSYIAGIFVDQTSRSLGIGTILLNALKADKHELHLSVYVKNQTAIHFYEKVGFQIQNKQIDQETKEAEYIMTWKKP